MSLRVGPSALIARASASFFNTTCHYDRQGGNKHSRPNRGMVRQKAWLGPSKDLAFLQSCSWQVPSSCLMSRYGLTDHQCGTCGWLPLISESWTDWPVDWQVSGLSISGEQQRVPLSQAFQDCTASYFGFRECCLDEAESHACHAALAASSTRVFFLDDGGEEGEQYPYSRDAGFLVARHPEGEPARSGQPVNQSTDEAVFPNTGVRVSCCSHHSALKTAFRMIFCNKRKGIEKRVGLFTITSKQIRKNSDHMIIPT